MSFYDLNEVFYSLPGWPSQIVFAILVALYTHLFFGFWLVRKRIPGRVCKYFLARTIISVCYIFFKAEDPDFKLLDIFLPLYFINYLDGLIILNGWGLYRCKSLRQAIKKLITFRS